ncbi:hypothetical protein T492DRAFT_253996 [Pavlovales sp. CCMP2436]|nr:hypothetical protein T492DRAFT_253996 [Pavlovales sp. CCMP2436]
MHKHQFTVAGTLLHLLLPDEISLVSLSLCPCIDEAASDAIFMCVRVYIYLYITDSYLFMYIITYINFSGTFVRFALPDDIFIFISCINDAASDAMCVCACACVCVNTYRNVRPCK